MSMSPTPTPSPSPGPSRRQLSPEADEPSQSSSRTTSSRSTRQPILFTHILLPPLPKTAEWHAVKKAAERGSLAKKRKRVPASSDAQDEERPVKRVRTYEGRNTRASAHSGRTTVTRNTARPTTRSRQAQPDEIIDISDSSDEKPRRRPPRRARPINLVDSSGSEPEIEPTATTSRHISNVTSHRTSKSIPSPTPKPSSKRRRDSTPSDTTTRPTTRGTSRAAVNDETDSPSRSPLQPTNTYSPLTGRARYRKPLPRMRVAQPHRDTPTPPPVRRGRKRKRDSSGLDSEEEEEEDELAGSEEEETPPPPPLLPPQEDEEIDELDSDSDEPVPAPAPAPVQLARPSLRSPSIQTHTARTQPASSVIEIEDSDDEHQQPQPSARMDVIDVDALSDAPGRPSVSPIPQPSAAAAPSPTPLLSPQPRQAPITRSSRARSHIPALPPPSPPAQRAPSSTPSDAETAPMTRGRAARATKMSAKARGKQRAPTPERTPQPVRRWGASGSGSDNEVGYGHEQEEEQPEDEEEQEPSANEDEDGSISGSESGEEDDILYEEAPDPIDASDTEVPRAGPSRLQPSTSPSRTASVSRPVSQSASASSKSDDDNDSNSDDSSTPPAKPKTRSTKSITNTKTRPGPKTQNRKTNPQPKTKTKPKPGPKSAGRRVWDKSLEQEENRELRKGQGNGNGRVCHQCRNSKNRAPHWSCGRGSCALVYCEKCLATRYGYTPAHIAGRNGCPLCRGLCNCSNCLIKANLEGHKNIFNELVTAIRKGTGTLTPRAWLKQRGLHLGYPDADDDFDDAHSNSSVTPTPPRRARTTTVRVVPDDRPPVVARYKAILEREAVERKRKGGVWYIGMPPPVGEEQASIRRATDVVREWEVWRKERAAGTAGTHGSTTGTASSSRVPPVADDSDDEAVEAALELDRSSADQEASRKTATAGPSTAAPPIGDRLAPARPAVTSTATTSTLVDSLQAHPHMPPKSIAAPAAASSTSTSAVPRRKPFIPCNPRQFIGLPLRVFGAPPPRRQQASSRVPVVQPRPTPPQQLQQQHQQHQHQLALQHQLAAQRAEQARRAEQGLVGVDPRMLGGTTSLSPLGGRWFRKHLLDVSDTDEEVPTSGFGVAKAPKRRPKRQPRRRRVSHEDESDSSDSSTESDEYVPELQPAPHRTGGSTSTTTSTSNKSVTLKILLPPPGVGRRAIPGPSHSGSSSTSRSTTRSPTPQPATLPTLVASNSFTSAGNGIYEPALSPGMVSLGSSSYPPPYSAAYITEHGGLTHGEPSTANDTDMVDDYLIADSADATDGQSSHAAVEDTTGMLQFEFGFGGMSDISSLTALSSASASISSFAQPDFVSDDFIRPDSGASDVWFHAGQPQLGFEDGDAVDGAEARTTTDA